MHIVCANCLTTNNIPEEKKQNNPKCGKCKAPIFDGQVITITQNNFYTHTQRNHVATIIDFWAPWCGPCQSFAPVYAKIAEENATDFRFGKLNTEEEGFVAQMFDIRSIPTFIAFKDGKVLGQVSGALPKAQFEQWLAQFK